MRLEVAVDSVYMFGHNNAEILIDDIIMQSKQTRVSTTCLPMHIIHHYVL